MRLWHICAAVRIALSDPASCVSLSDPSACPLVHSFRARGCSISMAQPDPPRGAGGSGAGHQGNRGSGGGGRRRDGPRSAAGSSLPYRTKACYRFAAPGGCYLGDRCTFLHAAGDAAQASHGGVSSGGHGGRGGPVALASQTRRDHHSAATASASSASSASLLSSPASSTPDAAYRTPFHILIDKVRSTRPRGGWRLCLAMCLLLNRGFRCLFL